MPQQPVVSNTSPLINLAGVGLLNLLTDLYTEIWIPDVVMTEYEAGRPTDIPNLVTFSWLVVQPVVIDPTLHHIADLGASEAAAITLAQKSVARMIVLNDQVARRVARQRGLPIVGTMGILLAAKQNGLIPRVGPIIDTMQAQGRWLSNELRTQVVRAAGEDTS